MLSGSRLRHKLAIWRALSRLEKAWFLPAWILIGLARIAVLSIPFRRLARWLGHDTRGRAVTLLLDPAQTARARRISRVIHLAARYAPWQSNCLAQSIVARLMLGLHGIPYTLYFGLARDTKSSGLTAHAWVTAGSVHVTDGVSFNRYTVVGVFITPGLSIDGPYRDLASQTHPGSVPAAPVKLVKQGCPVL